MWRENKVSVKIIREIWGCHWLVWYADISAQNFHHFLKGLFLYCSFKWQSFCLIRSFIQFYYFISLAGKSHKKCFIFHRQNSVTGAGRVTCCLTRKPQTLVGTLVALPREAKSFPGLYQRTELDMWTPAPEYDPVTTVHWSQHYGGTQSSQLRYGEH